MPSVFEQLKPLLDAQVDNGLSDSITYKVDGVPIERAPGDPTIPGFLNFEADDGGLIEGITPQVMRWRLKVPAQYLPAGGPSMAHTIESPKLDGVYRPGPSNKSNDGTHWLCDLQRAPGP